MTPVIVKWEDAVHNNDFQGSPGEAIDQLETPICIAIGFLVSKTKKNLILACEKDEDNKEIRFCITIPISLVREITELCPTNTASI